MATGTGIVPTRAMRNLALTDPFRTFQQRLGRLFEEGFGLTPLGEESWSLSTWAPACDIYESDDAIIVKADLPEVKRENISVSFENNTLTIRGERKFEEETKRENYHRVERSYGEFIRSFALPAFVDAAKINAEFKDGVLRVTLPKREEAKPKQVEIKVK
jgi:HSP20 family protein